MPTTSRLALPYPTPDDNPDGPAQIQALAERVDAVVVVPDAGDLKVSARTAEHGNWIKADGRTLTSGQYTPLRDALIADGSPYGSSSGNPKLPDLRGRVPLGAGTGAGLTARANGQAGGAETHALAHAEMPNHRHAHFAETAMRAGFGKLIAPTETDLDGAVPGSTLAPSVTLHSQPSLVMSGDLSVSSAAGELYVVNSSGAIAYTVGTAHNNLPPYLVGTWFIYAA